MLRQLTGQIRSHKTVNDGGHNRLPEAWLFLAGVPPCGFSTVPRLDVASHHRPLGGFAVVTVRTGDLYGLVRTDLTGNLSKHIHVPDLGLKLPSQVISDLGPEHKYALIVYQSNPFSQIDFLTSLDTKQIQHHVTKIQQDYIVCDNISSKIQRRRRHQFFWRICGYNSGFFG